MPQRGGDGTYVDRWVILDVVANGQVDPLVRRGEELAGRRVVLHDVDHVGGTDTGLEEQTSRSEGTSGEDNATLRRQRDNLAIAARSVSASRFPRRGRLTPSLKAQVSFVRTPLIWAPFRITFWT